MLHHRRMVISWGAALILVVGCTTDIEPTADVTPSNTDTAQAVDTNGLPGTPAPIYITTMTHLEGGWDYSGPGGKTKFDRDVEKIGLAMDTFDKFGALLTIESEIPFSTAEAEWKSGIFTELMNRGHGVGTHCDITPDQPVVSAEEFAKQFTERKVALDALIGSENNLGCSGGQGRNDWIVGAHLAGFKYIDGVVGFGFLSMPVENRPEGWTDDYILKDGHYHDQVPVDLAERIHPFMLDDAQDFVPDAPGKVLLSAGGLGRLDKFAELETGESCQPSCSFGNDDVDAAFRRIDEALALHDVTRIGKIDIYFPLSNFKEESLPYIESFLMRLKKDYIDTGKLTWATQRQLYEAYVDWNKTK